MSSILEALEKLERGRPEGATSGSLPGAPTGPPPPPKRRGPLLIATVLAVLGAAIAG